MKIRFGENMLLQTTQKHGTGSAWFTALHDTRRARFGEACIVYLEYLAK